MNPDTEFIGYLYSVLFTSCPIYPDSGHPIIRLQTEELSAAWEHTESQIRN